METLTKDQEIEYWKARAEAYREQYSHLQTINHFLQKDFDRYYTIQNSPFVVVYIADSPYYGDLLDKELDRIFNETLKEDDE